MADLTWSTRVTYKGYIERTILPTLGHLPLRRVDTATLDPAGRQPMHPDSVTHRFSWLARRLGLRTRLHDLRHYPATQLIAGGGATTLRVYILPGGGRLTRS